MLDMAAPLDRTHHLAVFNIGRPTAPLDSAQLQAFMDGLDPINALAERAPGFVWRYTAEGTNNATAARPFDDDVIVNFGVWESREQLWDFVYRSDHLDFLRRRREWFQHMAGAIPGLVVGTGWPYPVDGGGAGQTAPAAPRGTQSSRLHVSGAV